MALGCTGWGVGGVRLILPSSLATDRHIEKDKRADGRQGQLSDTRTEAKNIRVLIYWHCMRICPATSQVDEHFSLLSE